MIVSTRRRSAAARIDVGGGELVIRSLDDDDPILTAGLDEDWRHTSGSPLDDPHVGRIDPHDAKFLTVASPNRSFPTLATISTSLPQSLAATA